MSKTQFCNFCHNPIAENATCVHCGPSIFSEYGVLYYAATFSHVDITFALTSKYLVLKSNATDMVAASFGLVGALVSTAMQNSDKNVGFYDLKEIKYVVHPCPLKWNKAECIFRFVNQDDTDFIIALNKKAATNFSNALISVGVTLQDASMQQADGICCHKPCVNKKTFNTRVAHSAGSFVQMTKEQFVVPEMENVGVTFAQNWCSRCGAMLFSKARFCTKCGHQTTTAELGKKKCPSCGIVFDGKNSFCTSCGTKLI